MEPTILRLMTALVLCAASAQASGGKGAGAFPTPHEIFANAADGGPDDGVNIPPAHPPTTQLDRNEISRLVQFATKLHQRTDTDTQSSGWLTRRTATLLGKTSPDGTIALDHVEFRRKAFGDGKEHVFSLYIDGRIEYKLSGEDPNGRFASLIAPAVQQILREELQFWIPFNPRG